MKNLILTLTLFTATSALADINLTKLAGSWAMNCTQSQNSNGKQGNLIETYTFNANGSYRLTRQWHKDAACKELIESESQTGTITIGKENTNNGFNPAGTYEVQYKHKDITELGLLWVDESYTKLRVAKGFGKSQNTMLGLFEYKKN